MIDGVKTSHPKNLHACRCTVTIGSYPLIEHIILGILKLFFKNFKALQFSCMSAIFFFNNMKVVSSMVYAQYRLINPKNWCEIKAIAGMHFK